MCAGTDADTYLWQVSPPPKKPFWLKFVLPLAERRGVEQVQFVLAARCSESG